MEGNIEDIDGQFMKYTDSQKSVTTYNSYSQDFTDSCSDKNQSSGKETYVIDDIDIDSEKVYPLHSDESILNFGSEDIAVRGEGSKITKSWRNRSESVFVENTFTQTSKTVFELRNEVSIQNTVELQHFETQTSRVTISERENDDTIKENHDGIEKRIQHVSENDEIKLKTLFSNSLDETSSSMRESEIDDGINNYYKEDFVAVKNHESNGVSNEYYNETESMEEDLCNVNYDIEEDSLMRNEIDENQQNYSSDSDTLESLENDVVGLNQSFTNMPSLNAFPDSTIYDVSVLTTVTEETNINNSMLNVSQFLNSANNIQPHKDPHRAARSKFRIQSLFNNTVTSESEYNTLQLPPINATINPPISVSNKKMQFQNRNVEKEQQIISSRLHVCQNLASGENTNNAEQGQLPPISFNMFTNQYNKVQKLFQNKDQGRSDEIDIKDKIQDLKVSYTKTKPQVMKMNKSPVKFGEPKVKEVAEKGCEALCSDIMRRLQSNTWQDIAKTLSCLPELLDSFWSVIPEMRIADLLRLIVSLVESPRTQVAQAACEAAAQLLKHTNFTKKPEFNEAMGVLLAKTNSYNRAVRRAANLALDQVVVALHHTHCSTAICISGVEHKSPLVRCAASRLLVVCCALAEGGRRLLRSRPPSAAAARRHVLQAMAALLQDKNLETRKYAERLYAILRPLPNFEAYFLSDVDAQLASDYMNKYDHLLNTKNTQ